jgi:hypothetical protein
MSCPHRIEYIDNHRQSNGLRCETISQAPRCLLQLPSHWSEGAKKLGSLRWIGSGGDCLVFGVCSSANCPDELQKNLLITGEPQ